MSKTKQKSVLVRMSDEEYDELRARSSRAAMSMNGYLLNKALGKMPATPSSYEAMSTRLAKVEERLGGLEIAKQQGQSILSQKEE